jgi:hypothetical protein
LNFSLKFPEGPADRYGKEGWRPVNPTFSGNENLGSWRPVNPTHERGGYHRPPRPFFGAAPPTGFPGPRPRGTFVERLPGTPRETTRRIALLLALFLLLLPSTAPAAGEAVRNPHASFEDAPNCPRCHVLKGGAPVPDRILRASNDYCLECHSRESLGRMHPIGIRPGDRRGKRAIPAEYRLDDDGGLMCLTCHAAHSPYLSNERMSPRQRAEKSQAAPLYKTYYLRGTGPGTGPAALCGGCHKLP